MVIYFPLEENCVQRLYQYCYLRPPFGLYYSHQDIAIVFQAFLRRKEGPMLILAVERNDQSMDWSINFVKQ